MKKEKNKIKPFTFKIDIVNKTLSNPDSHIVRNLSSMKGQYLDETSYDEMIKKEDTVLYEVYEKLVPEIEGELIQGLSIVHPGKVGKEYFMTKGHFHSVLETAELYFCLKGHGYMMMETPEGDWSAEELLPYTASYVPGRWAHRSINVGNEDLLMLFVYPAHAGHNYATIETKGFRKLIIEDNGNPKIIDNPKWK
ncbi:MAG: glucose-6-phosphate isomerase [Clostridia bacterium]|nr:glucose-6-phosphate isomerase [Clostridia bacterium]